VLDEEEVEVSGTLIEMSNPVGVMSGDPEDINMLNKTPNKSVNN